MTSFVTCAHFPAPCLGLCLTWACACLVHAIKVSVSYACINYVVSGKGYCLKIAQYLWLLHYSHLSSAEIWALRWEIGQIYTIKGWALHASILCMLTSCELVFTYVASLLRVKGHWVCQPHSRADPYSGGDGQYEPDFMVFNGIYLLLLFLFLREKKL